MLERGLIRHGQLEEILRHSRETGLRFGEAGLALRFYTREQLVRVFGENNDSDFFYLDSRYFPESTRSLFTAEEILALGALPLGTKSERRFFRQRNILNLGLLNPKGQSREKATEAALKAAAQKLPAQSITEVKVFLILADQFLEVLRSVFGVGEIELRKFDSGKMDPLLAMYLEQ